VSYCRFSDDDFRCNVYCFESNGGITTHVATTRVVGDPPHLDWGNLRSGSTEVFGQQYKAQMKWLETAERTPIGLPYDGESFHDPDLPSLLTRLTILRQAGYNVPDFVFDSIKKEMKND
jgi:hypothetical protein